jgi:hypothetical protein
MNRLKKIIEAAEADAGDEKDKEQDAPEETPPEKEEPAEPETPNVSFLDEYEKVKESFRQTWGKLLNFRQSAGTDEEKVEKLNSVVEHLTEINKVIA